MREHKYRAWHKKEKRFEYFTLRDLTLIDTETLVFDFDYYEWMECTGLKDKNGREIYDGDILAGYATHKKNFYAVVEFKNGMFIGRTIPWSKHTIVLKDIMTVKGYKYDEVIGNIMENPELLKGVKKEGGRK